MPAQDALVNLKSRLAKLYGNQAAQVEASILSLVEEYTSNTETISNSDDDPWDQRDVVLITYADQLRQTGMSPLAALGKWLGDTNLDDLLSVVHLLPFCPYSSDDGFSVIDYLAVDPDSGTWDDIAALDNQVDLMFDLVLNHISQHSDWFQKYLAGEEPYNRFFTEADPELDLTQVVRPRSLPLLTPVETNRGLKHVWTTFSADQIDLNYAEPEVLVRMLRVLLEYAKRGARIVRLDAVAFLWKEIGTNCLHLPETHEAVKLMSEVVQATFPRTLILTETNVPHAENVSYFGDVDPATGKGDEAQMVYQFSLPPLLLDAFTSGDAVYLRKWLSELAPPPPGCTFFNFTASHDGVGVRPLEGLVPDDRFDCMIEAVRARGGVINTRRRPDGSDVPYELNITYVDALSPTTRDEPADEELHARLFLSSQAVMMGLAGMPAVYFHSLVGTQNDYAGVEQSGINRRINRHKYDRTELDRHLSQADSLQQRIHTGYQQLLAVRREQPAFHPNAAQRVIDLGDDRLLAFVRENEAEAQNLLVVVNFAKEPVEFPLPAAMGGARDLLRNQSYAPNDKIEIAAGDFAYISS